MKKQLYYFLTLGLIFFFSCEQENLQNEELNQVNVTNKIYNENITQDDVNSFDEDSKTWNYNDDIKLINNERNQSNCNLQYTFNGSATNLFGDPIIDPETGGESFLFSWNFSNLIPCLGGATFQVQIEFKADPLYMCVGYPGTTSATYLYTTNITNIYGYQTLYLNPIGDDMLNDKTFKYRTIIKIKDCFQNGDCIIEGEWKGPLCSYMWI